MDCQNRKYIYPHRSIDYVKEELPILVPCGKCIPCLTTKRQEWIIRLEQEFKYSTSAQFITLTYDQKHMPSDYALNKKHLQDFMKRLRKRDGTNKIRYYATGEYGSKSGRPHYHVLLFNTEPELVAKSWVDSKGIPIGIMHIGKVTMSSIAYCTKYIIQPELITRDKQKPFALMSRAYGIGGRYLDDLMVAWHKEDNRNYMIKDGQKVRLPRFYKSKIWYHENEKEIVHETAKKHSLSIQKKKSDFYLKRYGKNAEAVRADAELRELQRIKTKVKFTQTF